MPQNPQLVYTTVNGAGQGRPQKVDAQGNTLVGKGLSTALNLTGAGSTVKATPGRVAKVSVIVAGSTVGTINDALIGAAAAPNEVYAIPNTVGVYDVDWPCLTAISVTPGTGQTVALSYD
jgi:hypothetical protein